jgi:hypothetical protein
MMNGHATSGGSPANAIINAPPAASTSPMSAKPTRRSAAACAREFQIACSSAEKSTASTITGVRA